MFRTKPVFLLILAIGLAVGQNAANAQTYSWLPGPNDPPGDWNNPANWDDVGGDFVPEGWVGENAQITNGGTAFVQDIIDNTGVSGDGSLGPGDIFLRNGSTLEIRTGAQMSTDSSGVNVNGVVEVETAATLRMIGSGRIAADVLSMGSDGIFDYRVTTDSAFSTAPASILGEAQLGGSLNIDFGAGTSFGPGSALRLVDAGSISGEFSQINVSGNVTGPTGLGEQYGIQHIAGGNGTIAQLVIEQVLVLTVDRDTMQVSISNPASTPIAIDGYTISSQTGAIADDSFAGLGTGWFTSPKTASRVTQLRTSGTTAFSNGVLSPLGAIFDPPPPAQLGVDTDDFEFSYTLPGDLEVRGHVNYVGDKRENNLVLTIDENGMAAIQNESVLTVAIEGYTISSSAGLLDSVNWDSLDEQNIEGGLWVASPQSNAFRVTELMVDASTTFTPLSGFNLGQLYSDPGAGSVADVTFQFLIAGEENPVTGVVVFGDLPSLAVGLDGDFNNDGKVDAADYVVWRKTLGDPANYSIWRANFGSVNPGSGSQELGAVPEPHALSLALFCCVSSVAWPIRRRLHA